MRSWCAVHVDVGYLLASAATYVTGSSLRRGVTVDYPTLIAGLTAQAEADSGLPLLRVNWYDSGIRHGGMPDYQQEEIGLLPRVKLRLGRLSYAGEQKGVDVRIGLDLAIQGRHRVADVIYLVSGDDDLTEAVEEAQSHGVQVVLLVVPDQRGGVHGVSKHLRREVDSVLVIDPEVITGTVRTLALPEALVPDLDGDRGASSASRGGTDHDGVEGSDEPGGTQASTRGEASDADGARPRLASPPASARTDAAAARAGQGTDAAAGAAVSEPASGPELAVPSPTVLAGRRASRLVLPGAEPGQVGMPPFVPENGVTFELVDAVAKQVVASWCATATPEALRSLRESEPVIPSDLDRALLLDLSRRGGDVDLDERARHDVRERFWTHVARVRPA